MAKEKKVAYPMLPVAHWWQLREKFKQSIPGVVTDSYLAAALQMEPKSARGNILPYLKAIGLIDEDGKALDRAREWRDDSQYVEVCKRIRETIYPDELIAAVPDPSGDRDSVERWFANQTGAGEKAVKRMAAFYIVVSEADVLKRPEKRTEKKTDRVQSPRKRKDNIVTVAPRGDKKETNDQPSGQMNSQQGFLPSININLEIHISADATPDQIDKIFESMAKHIYWKQ